MAHAGGYFAVFQPWLPEEPSDTVAGLRRAAGVPPDGASSGQVPIQRAGGIVGAESQIT